MKKINLIAMKYIILLLFYSQINAQEITPKNIIENFFEAFHKKDTASLKNNCHKEVILQTISNKNESSKLIHDQFSNFLKSIAGIPNTMTLQEKILDYKVEIDGDLAHVWTPYEFYINEKLSHFGVNSFTLIKESGQWKIIHLIDTRKKK